MARVKGQVAVVTWHDAWSNDGYYDTEDLKESRSHLPLMTAGILIHEDDECIKLAQDTYIEHDRHRKVMCIPRRYVVDVKVYNPALKVTR